VRILVHKKANTGQFQRGMIVAFGPPVPANLAKSPPTAPQASFANSSRRLNETTIAGAIALGLAALLVRGTLADGTETLGPASIPIATGTGIAAGGVGLNTQPGPLTVEVPPGAVVK
jgi:hypothetical protein